MNQTLKEDRESIAANVDMFVVQEGRYWVAVVPALRTTGYGKTEKEATNSLKVEMDLFFEEAHEKGTLPSLLIKYGWTLSSKFAFPPQTEIPVELLRNKESIHSVQRKVTIPM